jgi:N-acetylmuramoyl-L-alanine amidase
LGRRQLLRYAGASLILSVSPLAGAAAKLPSVLAVRIWPAADYTRVTLEHDGPLTHPFHGGNPDRLVVDIEGVEFNSVLDSLARKVVTDDSLYQACACRPLLARCGASGHGTQSPRQSAGF